jgi:hypothetical protein
MCFIGFMMTWISCLNFIIGGGIRLYNEGECIVEYVTTGYFVFELLMRLFGTGRGRESHLSLHTIPYYPSHSILVLTSFSITINLLSTSTYVVKKGLYLISYDGILDIISAAPIFFVPCYNYSFNPVMNWLQVLRIFRVLRLNRSLVLIKSELWNHIMTTLYQGTTAFTSNKYLYYYLIA